MQDFQLNEHGESVAVSFIRDSDTLQRLTEEWLTQEVIAVDTEFDRTNTYYHKLALIQIYDGKQIWFIDTLELGDLSALASVFESKDLIKVLHSCSEDLEALFHSYKFICHSIFDTQIAAGFCDMGISLGYLRLVELFMGVSLDKEQTKTDWLQRPLQQEQLIYAAQDVQFLLPTYFKLRDKLLELGTFDFAMQDSASIFEAIASPEDYDKFYLKLRGSARLNSEQTNRLKHLVSWREQLAQLKNTPKTFIFRDNQLLEICQIGKPKTSDLLEVGCHRASIRRYGSELLSVIEEADKVNPEFWPKPTPSFHKLPKAKLLAKQIKLLASDVANKTTIPAEVLTNKRLIEYYIMRKMNLEVRPNRFWNAWRRELLSKPFEKAYSNLQ